MLYLNRIFLINLLDLYVVMYMNLLSICTNSISLILLYHVIDLLIIMFIPQGKQTGKTEYKPTEKWPKLNALLSKKEEKIMERYSLNE